MQTKLNLRKVLALGGMAYDNGYLVFGNDYNHLFIVK